LEEKCTELFSEVFDLKMRLYERKSINQEAMSTNKISDDEKLRSQKKKNNCMKNVISNFYQRFLILKIKVKTKN
jgi:hypothetical protein